jgi:hypothetical protein
MERIDHAGALPDLPVQQINLYKSEGKGSVPLEALVNLLITKFALK